MRVGRKHRPLLGPTTTSGAAPVPPCRWRRRASARFGACTFSEMDSAARKPSILYEEQNASNASHSFCESNRSTSFVETNPRMTSSPNAATNESKACATTCLSTEPCWYRNFTTQRLTAMRRASPLRSFVMNAARRRPSYGGRCSTSEMAGYGSTSHLVRRRSTRVPVGVVPVAERDVILNMNCLRRPSHRLAKRQTGSNWA